MKSNFGTYILDMVTSCIKDFFTFATVNELCGTI